MSTRTLRPWTDLVRLHPDVEAGALTEAIFAIDLGAIAAGDPHVPVVNRGPEAFFRGTYLTADLRRLVDEVRGSFAGTALAGRKDGDGEALVTTTASGQAAFQKVLANWRALIAQRLRGGSFCEKEDDST